MSGPTSPPVAIGPLTGSYPIESRRQDGLAGSTQAQRDSAVQSTGSAAAEELNGAAEGRKAGILVLADVMPGLLA
jgi:hypothetical protein